MKISPEEQYYKDFIGEEAYNLLEKYKFKPIDFIIEDRLYKIEHPITY